MSRNTGHHISLLKRLTQTISKGQHLGVDTSRGKMGEVIHDRSSYLMFKNKQAKNNDQGEVYWLSISV